MKYIRNFDNLNSAKAATLYSPTLVEMKEGNETYLLSKDLGSKDTKLKVQVNSETGAPEIKKAYTITLNASGGGTVAGNGSYAEGTSVTITATANTGYIFSKWSDDNTNASRTITINNDITLTAIFEEVQKVTITIIDADYMHSTGAGVYNIGDTVIITAFEDDGPNTFRYWATVGENRQHTVISSSNPYQFNATKDLTIYMHITHSGGSN